MNAQRDNKINMTVGSPLRHILLFALPLFVGNIFQQIYSAVDTAVAGYTLGDGAIAAIGATSALYSLIIDLATGMNSGFAIVISHSFGEGNEDKLKKSVAGTLLLNFFITVIMTAISVLFLRPFMRFMNTPDSVFGEAYSYMIVLCGGMCFTMLYNTFAGVLRAVGDSRTPLYCLIGSCIVNIGLDLLFVGVFKLGVAGAAYATVAAQGLSSFLCIGIAFHKVREILPSKSDFRVPKDILKDLVSMGISMSLMYCVVDVGSVVFQRANNALGDEIISAHTAARRLINLFMQPLGTISVASSTFIGQNWGGGKKDRIKIALKEVMLLEITWSVLAILVVFLAGAGLVRLTTGTKNPEVISNAVMSLRLHIGFFPVLGVLLVLRTAMQSMGKKVVPILSSCIEMGLKFLSAFLLIPALGFFGTSVTEPSIWVCMMIFLVVAFLVQRKELFAAEH